MPAYNTVRYIDRAIQSALEQTFADFELLVIDDGSTDETRRKAEVHARVDARVRVWSTSNGGACRARNQALAQARGVLIAFLDSDDVWRPEYLETQVRTLADNPAVSAITANVLYLDGTRDGEPYWPPGDEVRRITLLDMIEQEDSVCIMCVFRREMYEQVGGFDERFVHGSEDYDFWMRSALAGFAFAQNRRPLALYRQRPDGASQRQLSMLTGITAALRKTLAACEERGLLAEQQAARAQLNRYERERLKVEGAAALRGGDFPTATDRFGRLYQLVGGAGPACLAAWSQVWPSSMRWADRLRRSVRGTL